MDVRIVGTGTANPPLRVSQKEIYDAYVNMVPLSERARCLLEKVLVQNESIAFRYMGAASLAECARETTQDQLITRYKKYAVATGVEAAQKALLSAGLGPEEIDGIVVNTCTGYLCPGLTSYIAEALPLRKTVKPFELQGMGCGGAIPGLETAYNYLQAHAESTILMAAVEICSATVFFNDEPASLVSNAIFGDGAAAVVLTNRPGARGLRVLDFASGLFPEHRRHLHYATEGSRLKNVLSRRVPTLGAKYGKQVIDNLLEKRGLQYTDIVHWVIHPGGQRVLDAFQKTLQLQTDQLQCSRSVLHDYGNMSSASVMFVLEETMRTQNPQAGELILLCSFGAGFSAFAALLEYL